MLPSVLIADLTFPAVALGRATGGEVRPASLVAAASREVGCTYRLQGGGVRMAAKDRAETPLMHATAPAVARRSGPCGRRPRGRCPPERTPASAGRPRGRPPARRHAGGARV